METKDRSTRGKAPTHSTSDVAAKSGDSTSRVNDDMFPNPNGRSKSDGRDRRDNKLLYCKREIYMATMNVRSIHVQNQREELARNFQDKGICILGIVDHKIVHEDLVTFQQFDEVTMITSSAWCNARNAAVSGVGLMLSKQATQALLEVVPLNECIITAHFSGNPAISVIVQYSPTEGSDTAEEHYNNVTAISAVPKLNVLLVLGDCNAHLGEEAVKHTYHKCTNSNDEHLLDLACEANLIVTNTAFQKRKGKLWTFLSDMTGSKSQIDYILINKKWKNSFKNVEAYSSFASTGSDHKIVIARLKLSRGSVKRLPEERSMIGKC